MVDFAILAPVPLEHLESGLDVVRGKGHVAFQSQKWQLFNEVEELRGADPVPVLIYPSHEDVGDTSYLIKWTGMCVGSTADGPGKLREEREGYRPPTTRKYPQDRAGEVAVFWFVQDLQRLPSGKEVPIRNLKSYKTGYWRMNSPPRGPEIISRPDWI